MVYVFLAEGFEEVEALTAVDVLRRAGVSVQSVLVTDSCGCAGSTGSCVSKAVCGAHGISVNADIMFEEADFDSCEMIVLPGGMPGTLNLAKHEGLAEQVKQFAVGAADGKYILSEYAHAQFTKNEYGEGVVAGAPLSSARATASSAMRAQGKRLSTLAAAHSKAQGWARLSARLSPA